MKDEKVITISLNTFQIKHNTKGILRMLTEEQIKWAKQHDWFCCDNNDGSIHVFDQQIEYDDHFEYKYIKTFNNFHELQKWTGNQNGT